MFNTLRQVHFSLLTVFASLLISSFPGFLELESNVFHGGRDFEISLDFRTDQFNALLLFTYNTHTEDYMLVSAIESAPWSRVEALRWWDDMSVTAVPAGGAGSRPTSRQPGEWRPAD